MNYLTAKSIMRDKLCIEYGLREAVFGKIEDFYA